MSKDGIFRNKLNWVSDFDFDHKVSSVFDDMAKRSIPYYLEIQKLCRDIALAFWQKDSALVDFGCSTGTTLFGLANVLDSKIIPMLGLDMSEDMLNKAREKQHQLGFPNISFQHCNLTSDWQTPEFSVGYMLWTLQFIRPLIRKQVLKRAYENCKPGGALVVVEKIISENNDFNRLQIDLYHRFKKNNGYNELEIAQKREALENILIPFTTKENEKLLSEVGFTQVECFSVGLTLQGLSR